MLITTAVVSAAALAAATVSVYSNSCIHHQSYSYTSEKLPKGFNGYRIVHISDLHNKRFGVNQGYLLNKIKEARPDIIVITGDIIYVRTKLRQVQARLKKVRPFIEGAAKIAPVYYCTGNHEVETGHQDYIWSKLKSWGAQVLINKTAVVEKGGNSLALIGVADPFYYGERHAYTPAKVQLQSLCTDNAHMFRIVLSHRPEMLDIYADCGADLVFCGHAHGGQMRIPFTAQGLYAPDQGVLPKYTQGVHQKGSTQMVISRGLGNSGFPQRLFNRPEIVVVTLKR